MGLIWTKESVEYRLGKMLPEAIYDCVDDLVAMSDGEIKHVEDEDDSFIVNGRKHTVTWKVEENA